jgi:succinate-acetate transporter protein
MFGPVSEPRPHDRSAPPGFEALARIVLRPIGSALPLGFVAAGGASLLLSAQQLRWIEGSEGDVMALALISFAVPLLLLAATFCFLGRDGAMGTAMGIFAGAFLAVGLVKVAYSANLRSDTIGILLLVAGAGLLVPAASSSAWKLIPALAVFVGAVRFMAGGAYEIDGGDTLRQVAGIAGVVFTGVALYAALALALEEVRGRAALPLARRGAGRDALTGNLADQLVSIEHEPGIRRQL